jgi:type I restriction enzyme R subunit
MVNQNPEQKARDNIDHMLNLAGWATQNRKEINWNASLGIAVREYPTETGPADYVLFIDRKPVGIIEAKKEDAGQNLTVVEEQSAEYASSKLKWIPVQPNTLPFVYESTGIRTRFRDNRDPKPHSREIFSFHRPETFKEWLKNDKSLRNRLGQIPVLPEDGLRECQISAITNLETSFKKARPRALIQMATGSGKTFTAITFVYRLLKYAKAKRILFLVDTKNLGEQAEQEFMAYQPNDDNRKFTELYNLQRLSSSFVPQDNQVYISTIQRMYSILRGEEMDEAAEETSLNEVQQVDQSKEVVYNEKLPLEFFDFVIVDECHRSIYNLWRQVLEYFDSFLIGLTATPDKRTFGFFNENVVSEYTHEQAVADGVNVGHDLFVIETEITQNGQKIAAKEWVDKRDKLTRQKRWEQLDEDETYSNKQLDKKVVNPSQIRNIIKAFKENLPTMFPHREEVPKTLIFAKTDSHADDIINIVREEFGEGNDFCKKVTYQAEEDPKSILASFRNDYNPRIAVTVDMIATGTDVKALECLLFMRDVKSKNYFEQMKGRGTRTMNYDDLKKVTPSVVSNKSHFVIVDAIGATKSVKTDSRPLERKKSVSLENLLTNVLMGAKDEDTLLSLANRLGRLEKQITPQEREKFTELSGGTSINTVVNDMLDAYNPDIVTDKTRERFELDEEAEPSQEQFAEVQEELAGEATKVFSGALNQYLVHIRTEHEQIIDTVNIDEVTKAEWDHNSKEKAEQLTQDFQSFLEEHKEEITALKIFFNEPYRLKELTEKMLKEVLETLKTNRPNLAPIQVWQAYEELDSSKSKCPAKELTLLVSLIRRVCGMDKTITSFEELVNLRFQDWVFGKQAGATKFSKEQMNWLHMIKEHISTSLHIETDDFDYHPFDSQGGLGKMHQLFGEDMDRIVVEMNEALMA